MTNREWAPTDPDSRTAGITWIELFALFDSTEARSKEANHIKDQEAAKRAAERKSKGVAAKKKQKGRKEHDDATTKPVLQEELAKFKAIFRDIAVHETKHDDAQASKANRDSS